MFAGIITHKKSNYIGVHTIFWKNELCTILYLLILYCLILITVCIYQPNTSQRLTQHSPRDWYFSTKIGAGVWDLLAQSLLISRVGAEQQLLRTITSSWIISWQHFNLCMNHLTLIILKGLLLLMLCSCCTYRGSHLERISV